MATYTVDTDKIFLRCCDKSEGLIELCEIESVDIPLIEEKDWTQHEPFYLGTRNGYGQYTVLKLGDIEISGRNNVDRLIRDLYDSRCMVNREGLCILPAAEMIKSKVVEFEVEYYRVFDLFNWSNYQNSPQSVTTSWSRNDLLTGRSILLPRPSDPEREIRLEHKVAELEKELELKNSRIKELEIKNNRRRIEELKLPGEDIRAPEVIFTSMLERVRVPYKLSKTNETKLGWPVRITCTYNNACDKPKTGTVMNTQLSKESMSSLGIDVQVRRDGMFDTENWWAVKISGFDEAVKITGYDRSSNSLNYYYKDPKSYYGTFIYYDGNRHLVPVAEYRKLKVPLPMAVDYEFTGDLTCIYLQGIGPRYGKFIRDRGTTS